MSHTGQVYVIQNTCVCHIKHMYVTYKTFECQTQDMCISYKAHVYVTKKTCVCHTQDKSLISYNLSCDIPVI